MTTLEGNFENTEAYENLEHLENETIEQMGKLQPIEIASDNINIDVLTVESLQSVKASGISFKGGNCKCSCDTSCTRGY